MKIKYTVSGSMKISGHLGADKDTFGVSNPDSAVFNTVLHFNNLSTQCEIDDVDGFINMMAAAAKQYAQILGALMNPATQAQDNQQDNTNHTQANKPTQEMNDLDQDVADFSSPADRFTPE